MLLREIPNIKINGKIIVTNQLVDLQAMFRVWTIANEDTSFDSIYLPDFKEGQVVPYKETQTTESWFIQHLAEILHSPVAECKFTYDFLLTPVLVPYTTRGEAENFVNLIRNCLEGTELSLLLLLSHFRQNADKKGTAYKPEHYHFLIPQGETDDEQFEQGIYRFIDNLKKQKLIGEIIVEVR